MLMMCLYVSVKLLSDRIDRLPADILRQCQVRFQQALVNYFPMEHLTPSVLVASEDFERPQVILTGPHGIFTMGAARSTIISGYKSKRLIVAMAPVMSTTWMKMVLRLIGTDDMLPLNHTAVQAEMSGDTTRDLIVIAGGFIELNTGNEIFSTMDDSKWAYWLLQCLRHGYDASFQWIHGATQVYHTGTSTMGMRLLMGTMGIPFFIPSGQYRTPFVAHNDVPMTVCGFRIQVKPMPAADRSSPELHALIQDFHTRVDNLLAKFPADKHRGQAPVVRVSNLTNESTTHQ
jgi:hypothetical protein